MVPSSELPRLHRYFFWLGIYWGGWSIVLFLFNPIGDVLDSYQDIESQHYSVFALVDTIANPKLPPFNSVQCLIVIHAPIFALFAVLRHRWTAYGGTGCGLAYLILMIAMTLDRWLADDLLNDAKGLAFIRSLVAVLWCAPAIPLMLHLERLRKAGFRYDRKLVNPSTVFAYQGQVVSRRIIGCYNACFRLMPWFWVGMSLLNFGVMPLELMEDGIVNAQTDLPLFMTLLGVFGCLGIIAKLLAIVAFNRHYGGTLVFLWVLFLAIVIATMTALVEHCLDSKYYYFLITKVVALGISLGAVALFTATLGFVTQSIRRAGLPPSIRVSDLVEVERAQLA